MDILDCIVVGAGIHGSATAYHLAKRGHSTLLLEQFPLPHSRGSSHGASRIIRSAYAEPWFAKMIHSAYIQWHKLEKETDSKLIIRSGLLCAAQSPSPFVDTIGQTLKKTGHAFEKLNSSELQPKYPMLSNMDTCEGIHDPNAGVIMADKCLIAFHTMYLKYGGEIRDGEAVTHIVPGDVVSVYTKEKRYRTRSLVLTVGSWINDIISPLGLILPLAVIRVRVNYWKVKTKGYEKGTFPCFVFYDFVKAPDGTLHDVYGLPSFEYPGMIKICVHGGASIHPDGRDLPTEDWDLTALQTIVEKHFPGVENKPSISESCIYTLSPDNSFLLDKHPHWKNIIIGAGFSGTGFKMAPVVGEMLADMATAKPCNFDMKPFKIARFNSAKL